MASISKDKNGNRAIQFIAADRKRRTVRLGKATKKAAETIKANVESILAAKFSGDSIDRATADWIGRIDQKLHDKLARVGLLPKRKSAEQATLGPFLDSYIAARSDVKPGTAIIYRQTRRCLVEYFCADKPLDEITAGDADDWRRWLTRPENEDDPS